MLNARQEQSEISTNTAHNSSKQNKHKLIMDVNVFYSVKVNIW